MSMHHTIADGQGMVMMGAGLLDLTRESSVSDEPMPEPPAPGRVDRGTITAAGGRSAARLFIATPLGRATVFNTKSLIDDALTDMGETCP